MGTLVGHIVPGTFFGIVGLWWCLNVFRDYYRSKLKNGEKFVNRPWYPMPCCSCKFPMESLFKVLAAVLGMAGELATAFDDKGVFVQIGNAQHMTMYFFFGLNGAMDLLVYLGVPFPEGIEAVTGVVAFAIEGLLFYFHLHGRTHMDVQVHMFLFLVIMACAFSIILEMYHRNAVIPSLCRAYFTITQGTWFYQVGFILYPPPGIKPWDQMDHMQMMMVTLIFTWHLGANLVLVLLLGLIVRAKVKSSGCTLVNDVEYQPISHRLLSPINHSYNGEIKEVRNGTQKLLDSDSESS